MAVVGVLALQGSYNEHMAALRRIGVKGVEVRKPEQLLGIDSLIIPGGESTTMAKLANYHNLVVPCTSRVRRRWKACLGNLCWAHLSCKQSSRAKNRGAGTCWRIRLYSPPKLFWESDCFSCSFKALRQSFPCQSFRRRKEGMIHAAVYLYGHLLYWK
uniref:glutaminase n=1 Tax=Zea mays TaxID=4577 RepID=A0A804P535_MAIZE